MIGTRKTEWYACLTEVFSFTYPNGVKLVLIRQNAPYTRGDADCIFCQTSCKQLVLLSIFI